MSEEFKDKIEHLEFMMEKLIESGIELEKRVEELENE